MANVLSYVVGFFIGLGCIGWIKTIYQQRELDNLLDIVTRQNNILGGLIQQNKDSVYVTKDILKSISELQESVKRLAK